MILATSTEFRRDDCEAVTTGFSGAIFQGYRTRGDAQAAFDYANAHGWTRSQSGVKRPFPNPGNVALLGHLRVGAISDRWYVVTIGVVPGVYRCL